MIASAGKRWFYAVAGSGVVLGIVNYFQSEKKCAETSWTTNFTPSVKWDDNWDRRSVSSLVQPAKKDDPEDKKRYIEEKDKHKPTAKRNIFLIRHGQYNISGKTDADRYLTTLGIEQANLVGQHLKDLKFNYTKMIQSTLTRAQETAKIIHKYIPNIPLETCDLLKEGSPIPPEPPSGSWRPEPQQFFEQGARIEAAFRKYFHRADPTQTSDSYDILVCHANVIRYFVCRVLQFPAEGWLRFGLCHCSLTWVAIHPNGGVSVYTIGTCGHLSRDTMTMKRTVLFD